MLNVTSETLRQFRPTVSALKAIDFCLEALCDDTTKSTGDLACEGCSYEEIIGTLLKAKDEIESLQGLLQEETL